MLLLLFFFHYNRTEQVYRFFQQWCPNIHNATDEESDDDITSTGSCAADEEVNVADLTLDYTHCNTLKNPNIFSVDFPSTLACLNLYISIHRAYIWWRHFIPIVPQLIHIPR